MSTQSCGTENLDEGLLLDPDQGTKLTVRDGHEIVKTWSDLELDWKPKWAFGALVYTIVFLLAYFFSYRTKYNNIITVVKWNRLDATPGIPVAFPKILLVADAAGETHWTHIPIFSRTSGSPARFQSSPYTQCDTTNSIRHDTIGDYDTFLIDLPSMNQCAITLLSEYLRASVDFEATTNSPCLLIGAFPPNASDSTISESLANNSAGSTLRYIPNDARIVVSVSRLQNEYLNGTRNVQYDLRIEWTPNPSATNASNENNTTRNPTTSSLLQTSAGYSARTTSATRTSENELPTASFPPDYQVSSTITPAKREPLPSSILHKRAPTSGRLDITLRYDSFLESVATEKREMRGQDVFFDALSLLSVMTLSANLMAGLILWRRKRKLLNQVGLR